MKKSGECSTSSKCYKHPVPEPTKEEMDRFYRDMNRAKKKPAILKIIQPYAQEFIPKMSQEQFPRPFGELYDPEALKMTYTKLLDECERVFKSIVVSLIVLYMQ